jgi:predicted nucleotidyltransferase
MFTAPVRIPSEAIAAFCKRNHVRKLSLFSSVLTERFGEDSDMLVEFDPEFGPGLLGIADMEIEPAEMLGTTCGQRMI